jgi:hypothetical protein
MHFLNDPVLSACLASPFVLNVIFLRILLWLFQRAPFLFMNSHHFCVISGQVQLLELIMARF